MQNPAVDRQCSVRLAVRDQSQQTRQWKAKAQRKYDLLVKENTSIYNADGTFPAALTFHWLHMDAMDGIADIRNALSHALSALLSDRDRLPLSLSLSRCRMMMMGMGTKVTAKIEKDHSIAIIAPRTSRLLPDIVLLLESKRR